MPSKTQSVLLGAAVYILASIVLRFIQPGIEVGVAGGAAFALLGCLLMLAFGALPAWHYTNTNRLSISAGTGAGMGALAVALGAIVLGLGMWLLVEMGVMPDPRIAAADQIDDLDEATAEMAEMMVMMAHPLISGAIGAVFGAIVGAVGGAIGASVFKKAEPPPAEGFDDFVG